MKNLLPALLILAIGIVIGKQFGKPYQTDAWDIEVHKADAWTRGLEQGERTSDKLYKFFTDAVIEIDPEVARRAFLLAAEKIKQEPAQTSGTNHQPQ